LLELPDQHCNIGSGLNINSNIASIYDFPAPRALSTAQSLRHTGKDTLCAIAGVLLEQSDSNRYSNIAAVYYFPAPRALSIRLLALNTGKKNMSIFIRNCPRTIAGRAFYQHEVLW